MTSSPEDEERWELDGASKSDVHFVLDRSGAYILWNDSACHEYSPWAVSVLYEPTFSKFILYIHTIGCKSMSTLIGRMYFVI